MQNKKTPYIRRLGKDLKRYSGAYVMAIPVVAFYLLFCYKPMYGIIIAFKDYSPAAGIWGSDWASNHGLQNFIDFFQSYYFGRILKNTLVISLTSILFGFPAPIILALLLNELRNEKFKRITQTISYMPHFISLVVICSMIKMFTSDKGLVTYLLSFLGGPEISLLTKPQYFVPIYVISGIWQELGWGAIIYLAALSGIDQELYEAARIDGANRWQQTLHVTLPGISSTIIIMLLLRMGSVMSVGYEKIILLYNEGIYETADVISTFVYRKGLQDFQWSYSTAVGIFNSVINFIIVVLFNRISRKFGEVSLW
ncbi:MAG TPA: ABC transporter permease subunit [Candidatus Eisenbergiella stercoravium]|nr:ABC transporter permease subunit [Candidatus Eisenbergiella stercoravium]